MPRQIPTPSGDTHGGPRPGAGRPSRSGTPRVNLRCRIDVRTQQRLDQERNRLGIGLGELIDRMVGALTKTKEK